MLATLVKNLFSRIDFRLFVMVRRSCVVRRSNIAPQASVRRRCLHEVFAKIRLRKDLETGAQVKDNGWNLVIVRVSNRQFYLFGSGQVLRFSVQFRGSAPESYKKGSNRFEKVRTGLNR